MFLRWRSYGHTKQWDRDVLWSAVLVEAVRVDGKPRQRHIAYLGGILQSKLMDPYACQRFWKQILERLLPLEDRVSPKDREKIFAAIATKVEGPIPTEKDWESHLVLWLSGMLKI
jgi:hypothetical protein